LAGHDECTSVICQKDGNLTEDAMNDRDKGKSRTGDHDESSAEKRTEKFGNRTVGRGMDSPDSTEAVLDASTGEPDPRASEKKGSDASPRKK
jgi:hypothetical protein